MALVTQYVVNDWSAWKGLLQLQHLLRKLPQPENWTYVRFGLTNNFDINHDGMFQSMQWLLYVPNSNCDSGAYAVPQAPFEISWTARNLLLLEKFREYPIFQSDECVIQKGFGFSFWGFWGLAKTSKIHSSYKFVLVFIFRRRYSIMTKSMRMMILQKPHLLIFPDSMFWSELWRRYQTPPHRYWLLLKIHWFTIIINI